jgi:hypothetical protein
MSKLKKIFLTLIFLLCCMCLLCAPGCANNNNEFEEYKKVVTKIMKQLNESARASQQQTSFTQNGLSVSTLALTPPKSTDLYMGNEINNILTIMRNDDEKEELDPVIYINRVYQYSLVMPIVIGDCITNEKDADKFFGIKVLVEESGNYFVTYKEGSNFYTYNYIYTDRNIPDDLTVYESAAIMYINYKSEKDFFFICYSLSNTGNNLFIYCDSDKNTFFMEFSDIDHEFNHNYAYFYSPKNSFCYVTENKRVIDSLSDVVLNYAPEINFGDYRDLLYDKQNYTLSEAQYNNSLAKNLDLGGGPTTNIDPNEVIQVELIFPKSEIETGIYYIGECDITSFSAKLTKRSGEENTIQLSQKNLARLKDNEKFNQLGTHEIELVFAGSKYSYSVRVMIVQSLDLDCFNDIEVEYSPEGYTYTLPELPEGLEAFNIPNSPFIDVGEYECGVTVTNGRTSRKYDFKIKILPKKIKKPILKESYIYSSDGPDDLIDTEYYTMEYYSSFEPSSDRQFWGYYVITVRLIQPFNPWNRPSFEWEDDTSNALFFEIPVYKKKVDLSKVEFEPLIDIPFVRNPQIKVVKLSDEILQELQDEEIEDFKLNSIMLLYEPLTSLHGELEIGLFHERLYADNITISYSMTVRKVKKPIVNENRVVEYTGEEVRFIDFMTIDDWFISLSGDLIQSLPGKYSVTIKLLYHEFSVWEDETTEDLVYEWEIVEAD